MRHAPELLLPAGSLAKMHAAFDYGADEATKTRDEPFPWFNTVFFSVLALVVLFIAVFVKRRVKRRPQMPVS